MGSKLGAGVGFRHVMVTENDERRRLVKGRVVKASETGK